MKKLLFAIGSIAAMTIIFSCSQDNLDETKKENSIKNTISPSATTNTTLQDTIPQTNDAPIDDRNPDRP